MKARIAKLASPEYAPSFELLTDDADSKRIAVLHHTDSDTAEEIAQAWNAAEKHAAICEKLVEFFEYWDNGTAGKSGASVIDELRQLMKGE